MTIMSDRWITRMATEHGMIEPFEGRQVRQGVISYGVSSYGYDMRVAREFRIFTNVLNSIVDPKAFYPNEGIAQVLFFKGSEPPEVSYRDKQGKYQGQVGVTLPKL